MCLYFKYATEHIFRYAEFAEGETHGEWCYKCERRVTGRTHHCEMIGVCIAHHNLVYFVMGCSGGSGLGFVTLWAVYCAAAAVIHERELARPQIPERFPSNIRCPRTGVGCAGVG